MTLPPLQWTNFVLRYPGSVGKVGENLAVTWGPGVARVVGEINFRVNSRITAKADSRGYNDTWDVWPLQGDCNDFAVTKRHELMLVGFTASVLLLEEVRLPSGEYHMILDVRTDQGEIVLDNLTEALMSRGNVPYQRIRGQSPSDPGVWET